MSLSVLPLATLSILIAAGVGLLLVTQPDRSTLQLAIVTSIAMPLMWWLVLALVYRYEQRYEQNADLPGALRPITVFVLKLPINSITVILFTHTMLPHRWQAGRAP